MNPEELQAQIDEAVALGKQAELEAALKKYKELFPGVKPQGVNPNTGESWDMDALFGDGKSTGLSTAGKIGVGAKGAGGTPQDQDCLVASGGLQDLSLPNC